MTGLIRNTEADAFAAVPIRARDPGVSRALVPALIAWMRSFMRPIDQWARMQVGLAAACTVAVSCVGAYQGWRGVHLARLEGSRAAIAALDASLADARGKVRQLPKLRRRAREIGAGAGPLGVAAQLQRLGDAAAVAGLTLEVVEPASVAADAPSTRPEEAPGALDVYGDAGAAADRADGIRMYRLQATGGFLSVLKFLDSLGAGPTTASPSEFRLKRGDEQLSLEATLMMSTMQDRSRQAAALRRDGRAIGDPIGDPVGDPVGDPIELGSRFADHVSARAPDPLPSGFAPTPELPPLPAVAPQVGDPFSVSERGKADAGAAARPRLIGIIFDASRRRAVFSSGADTALVANGDAIGHHRVRIDGETVTWVAAAVPPGRPADTDTTSDAYNAFAVPSARRRTNERVVSLQKAGL